MCSDSASMHKHTFSRSQKHKLSGLAARHPSLHLASLVLQAAAWRQWDGQDSLLAHITATRRVCLSLLDLYRRICNLTYITSIQTVYLWRLKWALAQSKPLKRLKLEKNAFKSESLIKRLLKMISDIQVQTISIIFWYLILQKRKKIYERWMYSPNSVESEDEIKACDTQFSLLFIPV